MHSSPMTSVASIITVNTVRFIAAESSRHQCCHALVALAVLRNEQRSSRQGLRLCVLE